MTMHHLGWGWFEAMLGGLALVALAAYCTAALGQRLAARRWSRWRSASFISGILLVLVALLPDLVAFAHRDIRGHMAQHLLLGMFAPLGLVLGAPLTLALRSCSAAAARRLVLLLRLRVVRAASHPVSALLLNVGGMALLYLTPLYGAMLDSYALHALIHWHFLVAGCLFTWAIAGPDPAPHRPSMRYRLVVVFVSMALHASLSKAMYAYGWPSGTSNSLGELRSAAQMMYYGGDLAEMLLVIALFGIWYAARQKRGQQAAALAEAAH